MLIYIDNGIKEDIESFDHEVDKDKGKTDCCKDKTTEWEIYGDIGYKCI